MGSLEGFLRLFGVYLLINQPAHPAFSAENAESMVFLAETRRFVQVNQIVLRWSLVKFVLGSQSTSSLTNKNRIEFNEFDCFFFHLRKSKKHKKKTCLRNSYELHCQFLAVVPAKHKSQI